MSDQIYRQAAIDAHCELCEDKGFCGDICPDVEVFRLIPSAQPEVIRCKDCKHYKFADNRAFGFPVKRCEWTGFEDVDNDDFCSRAERGDKMTREEAIDVIKHNYPSACFTDLCEAVEIALQALSAQPELIRCRNCKYQNKGSNEKESWNLCGYRPWMYVPTHDDHYCGYAERRTDE